MKPTRNCTRAISVTQEAEKQAKSIINAIYEGYFKCLVVAQPLVMPHVGHKCVLLFFIIPDKACTYGPKYRS